MNGTAQARWPGQSVETPWSGNPAVACPTQILAEAHNTEVRGQIPVARAEAARKELSEGRGDPVRDPSLCFHSRVQRLARTGPCRIDRISEAPFPQAGNDSEFPSCLSHSFLTLGGGGGGGTLRKSLYLPKPCLLT